MLIISRSLLSIAQASFSFKRLDMRTFTYATPTLIMHLSIVSLTTPRTGIGCDLTCQIPNFWGSLSYQIPTKAPAIPRIHVANLIGHHIIPTSIPTVKVNACMCAICRVYHTMSLVLNRRTAWVCSYSIFRCS